MQLESYRTVFAVVCLIGILFFASPAISLLIDPPAFEYFSELYILGPNHTMSNIPFNITSGETYNVYLGVKNSLGTSAYYTCLVKFGNQTDVEFNPLSITSFQSPSLYEYNLFLPDGQQWEAPLTFTVNSNVDVLNGSSKLSYITINGVDYYVDKESLWDTNALGYYYCILVELWIYNSTIGASQFHNRSVYFMLNMTQT